MANRLILISAISGIAFSLSSLSASESELSTRFTLTMKRAVVEAQKNDPWLVANKHSQDAIESMSIAADTLPDPKMSIGIANLASDTLDFNQEAMTQFKVGVSQMFPRGSSLEIKKKQLQLIGSQFPYQRENRRANVAVTASKLWLDAYEAQESIVLIENDRSLFEQLADVAEASYSSTVGKTRQQDIIRAQLELTRLEDRLTMLKQKQETSLQKLSQWMSQYLLNSDSSSAIEPAIKSSLIVLEKALPNIKMLQATLFNSTTEINQQLLFKYFSQHPAVNALDQKIKASQSGIDLAKQKYKPQWGVTAAYGTRNDAPNGVDRADLFSISVSFDIPLFTENRQDKQVQSAVSISAAVKTEKWLLIRKLIASFESYRAQLIRINERQALYQQRLLPQMHEQAEASLTAYTNDDGDFSEVVRSRIAELNASIDALSIDVERQKNIIHLNYFFIRRAEDLVSIEQSVKTSAAQSSKSKLNNRRGASS